MRPREVACRVTIRTLIFHERWRSTTAYLKTLQHIAQTQLERFDSQILVRLASRLYGYVPYNLDSIHKRPFQMRFTLWKGQFHPRKVARQSHVQYLGRNECGFGPCSDGERSVQECVYHKRPSLLVHVISEPSCPRDMCQAGMLSV